jgi:hypothetical protein
MVTKQFGATIPQPIAELLEIEAHKSNRTVDAQLVHILSERYKHLHRICECGFFVYHAADVHRCDACNELCCSLCSIPQPNEIVLCHTCAAGKGIDVSKAVSFRIVGEGKL